MTAMKPIEIAKARLLLTQPFFGTLLCTLPLIERDDIPTAATDMKSIFYNAEFIGSLTKPQVEFVLIHEVMHVALMHGLRLYDRDPMKFNIAADYIINWLAKKLGFTLIDGVMYDEKYADMPAEKIYDLLPDLPPPPAGGGGAGEGDEPGQGRKGVFGRDLLPPPTASQSETEALRQKIMGQVAQAATMARQAGKMPGELGRLIDKLLHPQVPWYDELRDYMKATVDDDESWSKRNRRFQNTYLPTRYSEKMGEIVFIGDTSGSYTPKELQISASEITAVVDQCRPSLTRVLWADTQIASEEVFEPGDPVVLTPKGGGGTNMCVPLAYAEQFDPTVVVMLTDGYTPWPDQEPPYPLIVCCTTDADVPIGRVIRMRT